MTAPHLALAPVIDAALRAAQRPDRMLAAARALGIDASRLSALVAAQTAPCLDCECSPCECVCDGCGADSPDACECGDYADDDRDDARDCGVRSRS